MAVCFTDNIIYNQSMKPTQRISGVFAAAVTPLNADYAIQTEALPSLLQFLAQRGCHGVLFFGTTGEGPSFSAEERIMVFQLAARIRQELPDFKLLAGTGTPSLDETIQITRAAFDCGFDGVVTLPPYYYRKATDEGLFAWYQQVIQRAVPGDGLMLGYHIPGTSGVALSIELLRRLKDIFPSQFAGLKDSSGELDFPRQLNTLFGDDLIVLTGNDKLFSQALEQHASGCITAMANLYSPYLRQVWDAYPQGNADNAAQAHLVALRQVFDQYPPAAPFIKAMLPRLYNLPAWPVRPPLVPVEPDVVEQALAELAALEDKTTETMA